MDYPTSIDITPFLQHYSLHDLSDSLTEELEEMCRVMIESFHHTGIVFVKDPRMNEGDNSVFIDMMQKFYADLAARIQREENPDKPFSEGKILWAIEDQPNEDSWPDFIPTDVPEWESVMNRWGRTLLEGLKTITCMFEKGTGLPLGTIANKFAHATHILNPSGFDLSVMGRGTVLTTVHYDISYITVHGNSGFPVFSIWLRDGRKVDVEIPEGYLMFQAGMIFEHITGGYVLAGHHIVLHSDKTALAVAQAKASGKSVWRINSSMFGNFETTQLIELIPQLEAHYTASLEETQAKYPSLTLKEYSRRVSSNLAEVQSSYEAASI
jgi:hypothetical protein